MALTFLLMFSFIDGASAALSGPETTSPSFTVRWTESSGGQRTAYLHESSNGTRWTSHNVTGRNAKSFNKPRGTYRFKLQRCIFEPELGRELCEPFGNTVTVRVFDASPAYCDSVRTSHTASGAPAAVFDRNTNTGIRSTYVNWQYIQCDFGEPTTLRAIRRYMLNSQGSTSGTRGLQGEAVAYSADGRNWTEFTGNNTLGWTGYRNYGARNHAWTQVNYGWSRWLGLRNAVQARYVRFQWDGLNPSESLNEVVFDYDPPPQPPAAPRLISPSPSSVVPPTGLNYRWSSSSRASYYLFCVSRSGVVCPTTEVASGDTRVIRTSQTSIGPDLSSFVNSTRNWTVAACDVRNRCTYQQNVRAITIRNPQPPPPPPPPRPDFDLTLQPTSQSIEWGEQATYAVQAQSRNGFTGTVRVAVCNLPRGVTASPVELSPNQTANLILTTLEAGTEDGDLRLDVRGVDISGNANLDPCGAGIGNQVASDRVRVELTIRRLQGLVVSGRSLVSSNMTCHYGGDVFTAERVAAGGPAVEFKRNGQRIGTNVNPGLYWTLSPKCRIGVVQHPLPAGTFGMYNLALLSPPASTTLGRSVNQPFPALFEVRYSPDDTIVVLKGPGTSTSGGTLPVFAVWDVFDGRQLCNNIGVPSDFREIRVVDSSVQFYRGANNQRYNICSF